MDSLLDVFKITWHNWDMVEERKQGLLGGSHVSGGVSLGSYVTGGVSLELYFVLASSCNPFSLILTPLHTR